jgi:hypothetical protein
MAFHDRRACDLQTLAQTFGAEKIQTISITAGFGEKDSQENYLSAWPAQFELPSACRAPTEPLPHGFKNG